MTVNEKGIKTTDGKQYDFDVIAIATGFDITTGGMTNMGLKSVKGTYLKDEWKRAAYTYLGMSMLTGNEMHLVLTDRYRNDGIRLSEHVPLVRTSRTDVALQRTDQC